MAHDMMSQFYTCLNLPLQEKVVELTRIIDQSSPNKDLQTLFPQLINNIFSNGWGLRIITCDVNRYDFEALIGFLEPQGPIFRLCYKLLFDTQLKYNLPLSVLPLDLQISLERGRSFQFYADMLIRDPNTLNVVALALNPFDYYIFNFALHLVNNNQNKSYWENWNSVYFALACDYLMHFLPSDPNVPVLPHIPNYAGKVPMTALLQSANRPLYSSSLLINLDLSGSTLSNQHTPQSQSRNEVWRSETVLQVFIDIWMSVEQFNARDLDMYQTNYQVNNSSPERVRTVRVLVKHLHSFTATHLSDPGIRFSELRKYARQILCMRAYHYIKHLVTTWPLDASFRLVMELWLSFIQPWRYIDNAINQDRFPASRFNQEDNNHTLDANYIQFIAENFPSYTCIFQLVLSRFLRLDLSTYKNAIMLFRLGKVFSQQDLVPILFNIEQAIMESGPNAYYSPSSNFPLDHSYTYNGISLQKWVAISKQAISELNLSTNFEYEPVWSDNMRRSATEFIKKIKLSKIAAEKNIEDFDRKINVHNKGLWVSIKQWLLIGTSYEDEVLFEESKKVPTYLNATIHYFSSIFGLNEDTILASEPILEDNSMEQSSIVNSTSFPMYITNKLRSNPTGLQYMGDPDLMPIMSYENTILVRMLYQIASKLNEVYGAQLSRWWHRRDWWGCVAREVLQGPRAVVAYEKRARGQRVRRAELPPRVSLRRLASRALLVPLLLACVLTHLLAGFSQLTLLLLVLTLWITTVLVKATLRMFNII